MKTQRERMINGELYYTGEFDKELHELFMRSRRITREYNQTTELEQEKRLSLLKELLGKTGEKLYIEPNFK